MGAALSILVIGESEEDASATLRALQRGGYDPVWEHVRSPAAVAEALDHGPWDLVIASCPVPGSGIAEALDLVRSRGLDLPFLIVSGAIGEDAVRAAIRAGAYDCLARDDGARVVSSVERALREAARRRERNAALELLRQSEERYRSLVENMSDLVVRVGVDGIISYVSPQVRELIGKGPEEVIGRAYSELVAPESAAYIGQQFALAQSGCHQRFHDVAVLHADGRVVPVEASVGLLHAADGTLLGVQAIVRDVSERRRAQQELSAAHHRLMNIIEFLPDATFVIDEHGCVIAWNRAIEEMTGVGKEGVMGKGDSAYALPFYGRRRPMLIDLVGSEGMLAGQTHYDTVQRNGETIYAEGHMPSLYGGRGGYVWGVASPLYDECGRRVGAIESVRDITGRKLAESALRESEERFRRLFDGIPACCYTFASDGTILDWNRACAAVYGWTAADAVGKRVWDLVVAGEHAEGMKRSVAAVFGGESLEGVELQARRADGETCYVLANQYPLRDARGEVLMGICAGLDVSAHRRLMEQLRQSQKMEAIGQLAGGIAHDFNNLLTVINGYSQFLVNSLEASDPLRQDAQEILAAGERAATMTRQLLAFSRRQVLEMRIVDLNDVLTGMGKMLPRLIGEHIALEMRLAPNLGHVRADPGQIEQVIVNLVVNARDAMPDGGTLVLETANVAWPGGPRLTRPDQEYGYVLLSVQDSGRGMSREVQERLFEPFFTTKEPGAGTGLGLSIVYGIVKQSDGEIAVASAEGQGTTLDIYLPRVREADQAGAEGALDRVARGAETILLLEDQTEVRRLTGRMLRDLGYTVIEATRGCDALEQLRVSGTEVDLVVTDVVMPEMDGRSFIEAVRAAQPDIAVVYMSGYSDHELLRRGVLSGEAPFVHKPFTAEELGRKVRQALEGRGAR